MYDLTQFSLIDLVRCGADLRVVGSNCATMEEVAGKVVGYLYDKLGDRDGARRGCVLVRFYVTLPLAELPFELQDFARGAASSMNLAPTTKCLTLLASRGDEPGWNSRETSVGHKAIPLPSAEVVAQLPMVAQLVHQLGLEITSLLEPDPAMLVDLEQRTFNVFHIVEALDSPHIPAQIGFVIPYKVCSVFGFGGILPNGELFATILFTKVTIPRDVAEVFRTVALNIKMAVLPFVAPGKFFSA